MIICKEVADKKGIIELLYKKETNQWHREVHKNGGTERENVEDSYRTISPESVMFEIDVDGKLAACFTRYENEYGRSMECFHVSKEFRKKEFLPLFWGIVKRTFGGDFWAGLYEQNESAVKHFKRQGFEVSDKIEREGKMLLIYKIKV